MGKKVSAGKLKSLANLKPRSKSEPEAKVSFPVQGRRIVNVDYLAKCSICTNCNKGIPLCHIVAETSRAGLCSYWKLLCDCGNEQTISTDQVLQEGCGRSSHKGIPVNQKFVIGTTCSGIAHSKASFLLACLNVPPVSANLADREKLRLAPFAKEMAMMACKEAAQLEKEMTLRDISKLPCEDDEKEAPPAYITSKNKVYSNMCSFFNMENLPRKRKFDDNSQMVQAKQPRESHGFSPPETSTPKMKKGLSEVTDVAIESSESSGSSFRAEFSSINLVSEELGTRSFDVAIASSTMEPTSLSTTPTSTTSTSKASPPQVSGAVNKKLLYRTNAMVPVTLGIDAAWQKKGSGRSYNSRSSHNTAIGHKTKLVVDFQMLQTGCHYCLKSPDGDCKRPDCKKNFDGSAKSMEAASAVRLVCRSEVLRDVGVKVARLATDEDATTHAAIAKALRGETIEKLLDPTHGLRTFKRDLYACSTPERLITYFAACATAALHNNRDNADGLRHDLLNMTKHATGDHSLCREWCEGKRNPDYKHKNLPANLTAEEVRNISGPLAKLASKSEMLAPLVSTQRNESFNALMAQVAPKSNNYNLSGTLYLKLCSAVLQFNTGARFPKLLFASRDLSPDRTGYHDTCHEKLEKGGINRTTRAAKRQRARKQRSRRGKIARQEQREVNTYRTGIALEPEAANPELRPEFIGRSASVSYSGMPFSKSPKVDLSAVALVFFDLETTGRSPAWHEIVQIAAQSGGAEFDCYAMPAKNIPTDATAVHGIRLAGGHLYHHTIQVNSVGLQEAMEQFLAYMESFKRKIVLVAHNLPFDLSFLYGAVEKLGLVERFEKVVIGGVCSLLMAKGVFKKSPNSPTDMKLGTLVAHFLGANYQFTAHDARGDVDALAKVYEHLGLLGDPTTYSVSLNYVKQRRLAADRYSTLAFLLKEDKNIKKAFLESVVEHGLDFCTLVNLKQELNDKEAFVNQLRDKFDGARKGTKNFHTSACALYDNL